MSAPEMPARADTRETAVESVLQQMRHVQTASRRGDADLTAQRAAERVVDGLRPDLGPAPTVGDRVSNAAQLERLDAGSIVELRDVFGVAWCSAPGRWVLSGIPDPMTSDDVVPWLPGTVRKLGGSA